MRRALWALPLLFAAALAGDAREEDYEKKAAAIEANDADAHFKLALWCESNGFPAHANRHYRAVVTLDPDHKAARRALGYERVHGRWVRGDDAKRAKGFVEHDGVWMTREEYKVYGADEIEAKRAREARKEGDRALKLAWNKDPDVRRRAMAMIDRIPERFRLRPLSIASRINRPDVRRWAVKSLGEMDDEKALPPLYKRAIFDKVEEIRKAAVQAIKETDAEGKIGPFVRALNSPFDEVRVHAIEALGDLGDPGAVGPLVARYQVTGGSGQSVYISQVNQISFVQDFDVEVAQTSFIADPVIGVIQDGLVLNFRALATSGYIDVYERPALNKALAKLTDKDFGDHPKKWAEWFKNERRAARVQKALAEEEAEG